MRLVVGAALYAPSQPRPAAELPPFGHLGLCFKPAAPDVDGGAAVPGAGQQHAVLEGDGHRQLPAGNDATAAAAAASIPCLPPHLDIILYIARREEGRDRERRERGRESGLPIATGSRLVTGQVRVLSFQSSDLVTFGRWLGRPTSTSTRTSRRTGRRVACTSRMTER